jgi:hypothetical protein
MEEQAGAEAQAGAEEQAGVEEGRAETFAVTRSAMVSPTVGHLR